MIGGDGRHLLQSRHPMQNPLGQIRVQPHPLELGHRQIGWLGPDLVGHADPADVVNVSGPAGRPYRVVIESDRDRGVGGQLRGGTRMPQGERAFQVHEVAERYQQVVQRRLVELRVAVRRVLQRRSPRRRRSRARPAATRDRRRTRPPPRGRTDRRAGCAPSPPRRRCRTPAGAPRPRRPAARRASRSGSRRRMRRSAVRRRRNVRTCTAAPSAHRRPGRSARPAAPPTCSASG